MQLLSSSTFCFGFRSFFRVPTIIIIAMGQLMNDAVINVYLMVLLLPSIYRVLSVEIIKWVKHTSKILRLLRQFKIHFESRLCASTRPDDRNTPFARCSPLSTRRTRPSTNFRRNHEHTRTRRTEWIINSIRFERRAQIGRSNLDVTIATN